MLFSARQHNSIHA